MGCGCNKKKEINTTKNKTTLVENFNPPVATTVPTSKPVKKPSLLKKAFNFSNALATHVADGLSKANDNEFAKRIELCMVCPHRNDATCGKCGCFIQTKAAWKTSECPDGRWPELKKE